MIFTEDSQLRIVYKFLLRILFAILLTLTILPPLTVAASEVSTDTAVFTDAAQATTYLREQLVARETEIHIKLTGVTLTGSDASAILENALAHTGVPDEGDYIRVNLSSCSYSLTTGADADGAYSILAFTPEWFTTREMEDEVDAAVDSLLEELDLWSRSDYEKIKGAYDWVTENVQYDFDNLDDDTYKLKYTPYAALMHHIAVCQGYAGLYYRLMLELGVDCRYISGVADGERHGWNIVCLEGKYYNMDPTWDRDLMGHYRQFLCTEANFTEHNRDGKFTTAEFHAAYPMAVVPYVFHVAASGTVNANIAWVLDGDTGTLTVAGKGAIPSYRFSRAPWYEYRESVKRIVVGEGITEVGERAFYWSTNCTSVTLPDSLIAIREYGFNNLRALQNITLPKNLKIIEFCGFSECVALKSITLPNSVTTVGSNAFSNCYGLKSATLSNGMKTVPSSMFGGDSNLQTVILPDGVTYIDDTAFINCGLRKITIPASVTGLGTSVFSGCQYMQAFSVEEGNRAFKAVNGVLFSADGTTLICYPSGVYGRYTVPEGTVRIDYGAFRRASVTGITFPSTLTTIGDYAFSYCTSLRSVSFPKNITRICDSAFRDCSWLYSVEFGNPSVVLEPGVFAQCDSLVNVNLPSKLSQIPGSLFYGCANLKNVTIPSTVTKIGSSAFLDCDSLVSITIPGNVKRLEQQAFDYCNKLETIILEEGVQSLGWISIRNAPALTKVVIPASVTSIDRECFEECPKVTLYVTCGTAGYRYAINHGLKYQAEHPYTSFTVIAPTCTEQGYTRQVCACGGRTSYTNYVSAKGHTYVPTITPPTCTSQGYTTYVCHCGDRFVDDYVDMSAHNLGEWEQTRKPTCTEAGEEQRGCADCAYLETRPITAAGHMYTHTVIPPTETEQGYTLHTCTVCGDSYKDSFVDPPKITPGDVNEDERVNRQDAIYLLYHVLLGSGRYPVSQECDFNRDGKLNRQDAIYLLYHVLLPSRYPLTVE